MKNTKKKTETEVKFRPRSERISKKDAVIVGEFLEKKFPTGQYTAEDVVRAATPKSSPIHDFFEWNTAKAAHQYRLSQAVTLICSIETVIDDIPAPVAVNVKIGNQRTYMETNKARQAPDLWQQVLDAALREIQGWKARYETLNQLKPIFRGIGVVERKLSNGNSKKGNKKGKTNKGRKTKNTAARTKGRGNNSRGRNASARQ